MTSGEIRKPSEVDQSTDSGRVNSPLFSDFCRLVNDRLDSHGATFFDLEGRNRSSLLGVDETVISVSKKDASSLELTYFKSGDDARESSPAAREIVDYKDTGNTTTETRAVFDGNGVPLVKVATTLDRDARTLTIEGSSSGETTKVLFVDGQPKSFELNLVSTDGTPDRHLLLTFNNGKLDVALNGAESDDTELRATIQREGLEALKKVIIANGLPLPPTTEFANADREPDSALVIPFISKLDSISVAASKSLTGALGLSETPGKIDPVSSPVVHLNSTNPFFADPGLVDGSSNMTGLDLPPVVSNPVSALGEPLPAVATSAQPGPELPPPVSKAVSPGAERPPVPLRPGGDLPPVVPNPIRPGADLAVTPGKQMIKALPEDLQQWAHCAVWDMTKGSISPAVQSGLLRADKQGYLKEFMRAVNTRLAEEKAGLRVVDTTAPNLPPGTRTFELNDNGKVVDSSIFTRPLTTINSLPKEFQETVRKAAQNLKDGKTAAGYEDLRNVLNVAVAKGKLPDVVEAFNTDMLRNGHPYRLVDMTPQGVGGKRIFSLESNNRQLGVIDVAIVARAPGNKAAVTRDSLAGEAPLPDGAAKFCERAFSPEARALVRKQGIENLERTSTDRDFIDGLKAIDSLANIHDTRSPSEAHGHFDTLLKLTDKNNPEAIRIVDSLAQKVGGKEKLALLVAQLKVGGADADAALATLKVGLPSAEERIDQLRIRAIMESIKSQPKSTQELKEIRQDLEDEALRGNKSAPDALKTVTTDLAVLDLNDPNKYEKAVQTIMDLAPTNQHARNVLTALIVPPSEAKAWQALPSVSTWHEYGDRTLPDVSNLTVEQQDKMRLTAINGLRRVASSQGGLTVAETTALARCLSYTANRGDAEHKIVTDIKLTFSDVIQKVDPAIYPAASLDYTKRVAQVINGIYEALPHTRESGSAGSIELAKLYGKIAGSENNRFDYKTNTGAEFKKQVEAFAKLAESGNPEAIEVLAAIAGGAGRNNSHANRFETDRSDNKDKPTTALATEASDALIKAAKASPENRRLILDVLTSDSHTKESVDGAHKLLTLAVVASLDPADIPEKVRTVLRVALHDLGTHELAVRAMLHLGPALDKSDFEKIAADLRPGDIDLIRYASHKLTPEQGKQFSDLLVAQASSSGGTEDSRTLAVRALAALGPRHATPLMMECLKSFGTKDGRTQLEQSLALAENPDGKPNAADRFQNEVALALIDICERSNEQGQKTEIWNAFSGGTWGRVFDHAMRFDEHLIWDRFHNLMRQNPENITFQRDMNKILRWDLSDRPTKVEAYKASTDAARLGANFRERGVQLPDEVLLRLCDSAIKRTGGFDQAKQIVDRLAILNALPADIRAAFTAFDRDLKPGAPFKFDGRQPMTAAVFNQLPPEVRKSIAGATTDLPDGVTIDGSLLIGKTIQPEVFNNLSPGLRKVLSGSEAKLPQAETLRLNGRTVEAHVFNSLPESVRKDLFGSSKPLTEAARVPDLSRVSLLGNQFNSLSAAQKRALGFDDIKMAPDASVSLAGRSIDAKLFNSLPPGVRRSITGSEELLSSERVIIDLSSLSIDAASFNSLPPDLRLNLSGARTLVSPQDLLRDLAAGTTDNTGALTHALTGQPDLETKLKEARSRVVEDIADERSKLDVLTVLHKKALEELATHADDGVGWWNKLTASVSDRFSAKQQAFIKSEELRISDVKGLEQRISAQQDKLRMAYQRSQVLDAVDLNFRFTKAQNGPLSVDADKLTVQAYTRFGLPFLNYAAPDIAKSLSLTGFSVEANPFKRLQDRGLTQFDRPKVNTKVGESGGAEEGLALLRAIKPVQPGDKGREAVFGTDAIGIRREAFSGLDADPAVRKLLEAASIAQVHLTSLSNEVTIVQKNGDKFEAFISDAKMRANAVKEALASLKPEEIKRLTELRDTWRQALSDGSISDPDAVKLLRTRVETLDKTLQLFDKNYDWTATCNRKATLEREIEEYKTNSSKLPSPPHDRLYDQIYNNLEKDGKVDIELLKSTYWHNRNQQNIRELKQINAAMRHRSDVDELTAFVNKPELSRSDFGEWFQTKGLEILGGIAAAAVVTAAVVLTFASFGAAAPVLVLAVAGTGGFMVGSELTKEGQRAAGIRSTGSLLGDQQRGAKIDNAYGEAKSMDLFDHVMTTYFKEFAVGVALNYFGVGLGNYLGAGLARCSSSARSMFFQQNAETLNKLAVNARRVEAEALKDLNFRNLVIGSFKEFKGQSKFMGAMAPTEQGIKRGANDLGAALGEGNAFVSFAAIVMTSAIFKGLNPSLAHSGAKANERAGGATEGNVTLRYRYNAEQSKVDAYIRDAIGRKSEIQITRDGFVEITSDGLRIEMTRASEVSHGAPVEVVLKQAASLPDNPGPRVELVSPVGPKENLTVQQRIDNLLEPVAKKETEIGKLDDAFNAREAELKQKIDKLPQTANGEAQFEVLNAQLKELKTETDRQKQTLRREADELRRDIESSDLFKQLQLAKTLSENVFPPGEYQLRVDGHPSIKLLVGKESYMDGDRVATRFVGENVPVEHVNQLLDALKQANIKPESVSVVSKEFGAEGGLTAFGKGYEVSINLGVGNQPVRMIFNHETGHLYDFRAFRPSADPLSTAAIREAYRQSLLKEGGPADVIARKLGIEPSKQSREKIADELCSPENHDFLADRTKTLEGRTKYLGSQGEVFAEMYKLHLEKARIVKETGKEPTYQELLKEFTEKYNPSRAEVMRDMADLFKVLEQHAFEGFQIPKAKATDGPAGTAQSVPAKGQSEPIVKVDNTFDSVEGEGALGPGQNVTFENGVILADGTGANANKVVAQGPGAEIKVKGDSQVSAFGGADVTGTGNSKSSLHGNSKGRFFEDANVTLTDKATAEVGERSSVTAYDDAHVKADMPFKNQNPKITLNDRARADVEVDSSVTVNGADAVVNISQNANVNLTLNGGKANITSRTTTLNGHGQIDLSGTSNLRVSVPDGKVLVVKVTSGQPKVDVVPGSKGEVRLVGADGKPLAKPASVADVPARGAADAPAKGDTAITLGGKDAAARLNEGTIVTDKQFPHGQERIDVYQATQTMADGSKRTVIVRTGRPPDGPLSEVLLKRVADERKALAASNAVNGESGKYPELVIREVQLNGVPTKVVVQEYAGTTLKDFRNSPQFNEVLADPGKLAAFERSLELAVAERHVLGDNDFTGLNLVVSKNAKGEYVVSNIDFGRSFDNKAIFPTWGIGGVKGDPTFARFIGKPVSPESRKKLQDFVDKVRDQSSAGEAFRADLKKAGFEDADIHLMRARAEILLSNGFPK